MLSGGTCDTNYIEIWTGSSSGRKLWKLCKDNVPSKPLKTFANQVLIRYVAKGVRSEFSATWTTSDVDYCSKVKLENHDQTSRNGFYEWSRADNAYKAVGGSDLFYQTSRTQGGPGWGVGSSGNRFGGYTTVKNRFLRFNIFNFIISRTMLCVLSTSEVCGGH